MCVPDGVGVRGHLVAHKPGLHKHLTQHTARPSSSSSTSSITRTSSISSSITSGSVIASVKAHAQGKLDALQSHVHLYRYFIYT